LKIGAEKPVHCKQVFPITEFIINGNDCNAINWFIDLKSIYLSIVKLMTFCFKRFFQIWHNNKQSVIIMNYVWCIAHTFAKFRNPNTLEIRVQIFLKFYFWIINFIITYSHNYNEGSPRLRCRGDVAAWKVWKINPTPSIFF